MTHRLATIHSVQTDDKRRTQHFSISVTVRSTNKKAQLSPTNLRDAKACQKLFLLEDVIIIIIIIIIFFNIKLTNATMCTIIKQMEQSIYKMQSI